MANVLKVELSGENTGTATINRQSQVQERVPYRVTFDGPSTTFVQACNAVATLDPGALSLGSARGLLYLLAYDGKRLAANPCVWEIACIFKLPIPTEEAAPSNPDPTGERWGIDIRINSTPFQVEIQRDTAGNMIANTVGDPITGIYVDQKIEQIEIEFTTNIVDWDGIDAAFGPTGRGAVNSADVSMTIRGQTRTFKTGDLKFDEYSLAYTLDPSGQTFPRMTYKLLWRADGWRRMIANKGLRIKTSGDVANIRSGNALITTPVYLTTVDSSNVVPTAIGDPVEIVNGSDGQPGTVIYDTADLGEILLWDLNT